MEAENANTKMTFAGVSFKTTKLSNVRRPALLKILRSGRVTVFLKYLHTDDYARDNDDNFSRGYLCDAAIETLARDIESGPGGWECSAWRQPGGELSLMCHTFLSYRLTEKTSA